jgi:two-component system, LytTR family, sensor kinase
MRPKADSTETERNFYSFWGLQVFGWAFYLIIYMFHMMMFRSPKAEDFIRILIGVAAGFFMTVLLRIPYRRINTMTCSSGGLSLRIVLGSVAAAQVWFWGARFLFASLYPGTGGFAAWIKNSHPVKFLYAGFFDTILVIIWSALYFLIRIWNDWNRQRRMSDASSLSAQNLQFQTLRFQLNPHFLFNALNSVRALISEDKATAKKLITELSEFLRYSLVSKDHPVVPLQCEIDAVKRYLSIEAIRYENKLDVTMTLDPETLDFPVVSYLVHPLVENAVRFGMRTSRMPLRVKILSRMENGSLSLSVYNSGHWMETGVLSHDNDGGSGNSLALIRRLLETEYPGQHRLDLVESDGFVCVSLHLNKRMGLKDEKALQSADCR